jgi:hypothetical protein
MLATNIALAGSDEPLPLLYAEANPAAFYDFADVRRNLDRYQALVDALEQGRGALASQILARLLPALPAGTRLERRVSFVFGAGADGWASNGVAAIDLEFYKDDLDAMLGLLAHETYHAAQSALAPTPATAASGAADDALEVLFKEGTASWVAAPQQLTAEERHTRVEAGVRLLHTVATGTPEEADRAVMEGTRGAGPFYWLGAAMARTIAEQDGSAAVAATLPGGPAAFAAAYLRAAQRAPHPPHSPAALTPLLHR